jgi:hypothetical protein
MSRRQGRRPPSADAGTGEAEPLESWLRLDRLTQSSIQPDRKPLHARSWGKTLGRGLLRAVIWP